MDPFQDFPSLARFFIDLDKTDHVARLAHRHQTLIVDAIKRALQESIAQVAAELEQERKALADIMIEMGGE